MVGTTGRDSTTIIYTSNIIHLGCRGKKGSGAVWERSWHGDLLRGVGAGSGKKVLASGGPPVSESGGVFGFPDFAKRTESIR